MIWANTFTYFEVTLYAKSHLSDEGKQKWNSYLCSHVLGYATIIGKETGRIVHFATRNGYCRTCDSAKKKIPRKTPSTDDCRRNWTGSSKAMEPDMCKGMLKDLWEKDVQVGTIIMDNDTTTIARARTEVKTMW